MPQYQSIWPYRNIPGQPSPTSDEPACHQHTETAQRRRPKTTRLWSSTSLQDRALEPYDSIGTGLTSYTWNFKLDGSDLAPIGETGELWLLGPRGDQGYTNEPTETTEPLFDGTNWLLRGCSKISHTEGHTGQVNRLD
ncbi:hypothetical protein IWW34DRAFT_789654 [Fusarium oxysporum f. sp. albedinis]|nr:hypothetical protein IWW34DRAFT_789654 [Fusarium oxysporum f. sp. albedinis]